MSVIEIPDPITIGQTDKPLDARTRIDSIAQVGSIDNPFIGMMFYSLAERKTWKVTGLQSRLVGGVTVPDRMIDAYEEVPDAETIAALQETAQEHDEALADAAAHLEALQETAEQQETFNTGVTQKHGEYDERFSGQERFNTDAAGLLDELQEKKGDVKTVNGIVPDENGNVPLEVGGAVLPATITLPIPQDADNNTLSFIFDVCENGAFGEEDTTHILMNNHLAKMELFSNGSFEGVPGNGIGNPYYGDSISFTLDQDMFPGYVPGRTYYARYRWMDQSTGRTDWWGFKFTYDAVVQRPVKTNFGDNRSIPEEKTVSGEFTVDYLDGDIQQFKLTTDATLYKENVINVPFRQAIQMIINPNGHTLTLVNGTSTIDYTMKCLVGVVDIGVIIMVDNEIN